MKADECVAENSKPDYALKIIKTSPLSASSFTLQLFGGKPCWHSCGRECSVKRSTELLLAELLGDGDDEY